MKEHPEFTRARIQLLREYPWLRELDSELAAFVYAIRGETRRRRGREELLDKVHAIATRFTYHKIPDGDYFMFYMLTTGALPHIWEFGEAARFVWTPRIYIGADEEFDEVLRHTERELRAVWHQVLAARPLRWAAGMSDKKIREKVQWYFDVKINGKSVRAMEMGEGPSEPTIRRGIQHVQRLLGIATRPGRPRN